MSLILLNFMSFGPPVFRTKISGDLYLLQKLFTLLFDVVSKSFEPSLITSRQTPSRFVAIDLPIPEVPLVQSLHSKPHPGIFF